jgi:hypothetical protein
MSSQQDSNQPHVPHTDIPLERQDRAEPSRSGMNRSSMEQSRLSHKDPGRVSPRAARHDIGHYEREDNTIPFNDQASSARSAPRKLVSDSEHGKHQTNTRPLGDQTSKNSAHRKPVPPLDDRDHQVTHTAPADRADEHLSSRTHHLRWDAEGNRIRDVEVVSS